MGILEWLGAHLLGPLANLYRAFMARPRPDVRLLELKRAGASAGRLDFALQVQNYGNQSARATVTARVGDQDVTATPAVLDLLGNGPPETVSIVVPRPELGDLMPECNNEPTLYGRELLVELTNDRHRSTETWRELIYDAETNRARYEVQERWWRLGRGEETEADTRAWLTSNMLRREDERRDNL
jgi:hypothetical protein